MQCVTYFVISFIVFEQRTQNMVIIFKVMIYIDGILQVLTLSLYNFFNGNKIFAFFNIQYCGVVLNQSIFKDVVVVYVRSGVSNKESLGCAMD